mmetsp:Transcript_12706/g.23818  ORF Transcript_12706/g.23818 Transcript_12706/m.23818 type:complete len:573 (-) Transcript_12706:37-1755(-)
MNTSFKQWYKIIAVLALMVCILYLGIDHVVVRNNWFFLSDEEQQPAQIKNITTTARGQNKMFVYNNIRTKKEMPLVLGQALEGGVLPVRRFVLVGGREIATRENSDAIQCNILCLQDLQCHAWYLNATFCHTYADDYDYPLDAFQAEGNNISSVIGFIQRNARVLRPVTSFVSSKRSSGTTSTTTNALAYYESVHANNSINSDRILYILHFHHEVVPEGLMRLLNEALPKTLQSQMDLVVVTPRSINLRDFGIALDVSKDGKQVSLIRIESLRNPFRSVPVQNSHWGQISNDNTSRRGANGIMSMPIARAKFPGYRGYLLMNDDAMLRSWVLDPKVWLDDRPWCTFPPGIYSERNQVKRRVRPRYPYGPYQWSWFNFDSGTVGGMEMRTRSNFDAALAALNDMCGEPIITKVMSKEAYTEFCVERKNTTLKPFVNGKADGLYVPNTNAFGSAIIDAITLFGEHDTFMEISYAMIYSMLVSHDKMLEMPYCDGFAARSQGQLVFKPYFRLTRNEGKKIHQCTLIHPLKFGFDDDFNYWKSIVAVKEHNSRGNNYTSWNNNTSNDGHETFWIPL